MAKQLEISQLSFEERKAFLDQKVVEYNTPNFIEEDPVAIPHRYTQKEDQEIAGFLAATIAWGNRKMIVRNGHRLMELLWDSPYAFVMEAKEGDLRPLDTFVHRTFNAIDLRFFVKGLRHLYLKHGGLEGVFNRYAEKDGLQEAIHQLKQHFFEIEHPDRTMKHISDPNKGSSAKRINMFLRWMVRDDAMGVDLGLWKQLSPAQLSCPLDVHSGRVARRLGLLQRKQDDAKALRELDGKLRQMDANDPVKYDFALFGLGVFEKF